MDERDLDVLAILRVRPFESYEAIGRELGLTGAAVSAKVDRLGEDGFLVGPSSRVAGEIIDRDEFLLEFRGVRGEGAVARLLEHPDVVTAMMDLDGRLLARAYFARDAQADPYKFARIAGAAPDVRRVPPDPRVAQVSWTQMEREVLAGILLDACAPVSAVASLTPYTTQAVRRSRDHLISAGALRIEPLLPLARATTLIVHAVRIPGGDDAAEKAQERFPQLRTWMSLDAPPERMLLCPARSLHEARVIHQEILDAIPGASISCWTEAAHDASKLVRWTMETAGLDAPPVIDATIHCGGYPLNLQKS